MGSEIVKQAFPSFLAPEIDSLFGLLQIPALSLPTRSFQVLVSEEHLVIPYRINLPANILETSADLSASQKGILYCLFSRHHDGFVRGRCLHEIMKYDYVWTVPYVIQLLGEYVVEIIDAIVTHLPQVDSVAYARFLAQNPHFYALTKQRVISYWDCYYRRQYPNFDDYAGARAIAYLDRFPRKTNFAQIEAQ